jgi:hypothetical protein
MHNQFLIEVYLGVIMFVQDYACYSHRELQNNALRTLVLG